MPPPPATSWLVHASNWLPALVALLSVATCVVRSNALFYVTLGLLVASFLVVAIQMNGRLFANTSHADWGSSVGTFVLGFGVFLFLMLSATQRASDSDGRSPTKNVAMFYAMAMTGYDEVFHQLPRHAITDADGKPLLSWRVQILPFIEQTPLYNQFKLTESWDSPSNLPFLERGPSLWTYSNLYADTPAKTPWQCFVGPGTAFDPAEKSLRLNHDFPDGAGQTILVIEAPNRVL